MNWPNSKELHDRAVDFVRGLILATNYVFATTLLLEHVAFDRDLDDSWGTYPKERFAGFLVGMLHDVDQVADLLQILAWREPKEAA